MEAKPYSMQSPERVAEAYGGNKQKIAQAVQMGVIDPTSGLMAGMFIDRMRSAQAQEQAPNQTVAQRVLGPQAPPALPAGLGATPQGMQMAGGPGPQMAAPPQMIPPAPQGPVRMAVGGLTTLPVPDDMYDEQSFAGGGIVAFAGGGKYDAEIEALKRNVANPKLSSAEKQRATQELTRLLALPESRGNIGLGGKSLASLDAASRAANEAAGYYDYIKGVNPDVYNYVAVQDFNIPEPSRTSIPRAEGIPFMSARNPARTPAPPTAAPAAVVPPPAPLGDRGVVGAPRAPAGSSTATGGVPDYLKGLQATAVPGLGATQKEMLDLIGDVPAPKGTSDEAKAARKNEDLFSTLAQIGFGMAAGESPNALTNIGKAAAAAVPGMQEAIKERRKDTKEELQQQYAYELAKHGLSKDALVAAVGRTDTLTKNELAKVTALAEIKSKQIEGDKDRAVQRSGQANTSKYYDYLMNKDSDSITRDAKIILAAGKANSIEEARYMAWRATQVRPGAYGKTTDPNRARTEGEKAYKQQFTDFGKPEPKEGRAAWVANYVRNAMALDNEDESGLTTNPTGRLRFDESGNQL